MQLPFLIIQARFYEDIEDALLEGALAELERNQFSVRHVQVPGVLEVPVALAMLWDPAVYAGVVVLGCVIRGETTHYDTVANESNRAVTEFAVKNAVPLGNGILTVENRAQAMVRALVAEKDKGGAAAKAALALMNIKQQIGRA